MVYYYSLVSLTLAVASTSMTTQEIADHAGSALSHLTKSYLGVERVASEIKPTDFSTPRNDEGENFVKIMAETTTGKIKTRMEQVIVISPSASASIYCIFHYWRMGLYCIDINLSSKLNYTFTVAQESQRCPKTL